MTDSEAAPAATSAGRDRVAVLVTGMHRSGTSAVTRLISLLGAKLPSDLIPGRENDNEPGFWESQEVVDVNKALLEHGGSWWGGWQRIDPAYLAGRERARSRVAAYLAEQFADDDLIVIKDPRISRLLPFWRAALEEQGFRCVHVVVLRDPSAVVGSVERRNALNAKASVLGWLAHVLDAEAETRAEPRVFVSFERLLADWRGEADRIVTALGVSWPRTPDQAAPEVADFLQPGLAHASAERPEEGPVAAVWPVYEVLDRWCADDVRDGDSDLLERWREAFAPVRARSSVTTLITRGRKEVAKARRAEGDPSHTVLLDRFVWVPINNAAYSREAVVAWDWLLRERETQARIAELESRARLPVARIVGRVRRRLST